MALAQAKVRRPLVEKAWHPAWIEQNRPDSAMFPPSAPLSPLRLLLLCWTAGMLAAQVPPLVGNGGTEEAPIRTRGRSRNRRRPNPRPTSRPSRRPRPPCLARRRRTGPPSGGLARGNRAAALCRERHLSTGGPWSSASRTTGAGVAVRHHGRGDRLRPQPSGYFGLCRIFTGGPLAPERPVETPARQCRDRRRDAVGASPHSGILPFPMPATEAEPDQA